MFRIQSYFLLLVLFFNLFAGSSIAVAYNPLVRIGIIQHFGKNGNDAVLIKPQDPTGRLEVIFPKNADSTDLKDSTVVQADSLNLKVEKFPAPEGYPEMSRVIAGAYRTYEAAAYGAQLLRERFPSEDWQIVYPGPWQVWTASLQPEALMNALFREGFKSAFIQQRPQSRKILSWSAKVGKEIFQFHRSKMLVRNLSGQPIKVRDKTYAGAIEVSPDSFGTYTVINEVPIEQYLRGVVPFEIGPTSPKAALQAQAILARTYTLANLNRFLPEGYNLCATQDCQVYGGLGAANASIDQAIMETAGLVLRDREGQIAQVFYSSTDGGATANFSDIWPTKGMRYLTTASTCSSLPTRFDLSNENDARIFLTSSEAKSWSCYDAISPLFRWEKKIALSELTDNMNKARDRWKFAWPSFNKVTDLVITKRSQSGRILELTVKTDKGEFTVERDEVRAALGGLKSTFFVIEKVVSAEGAVTFVLKGGGFGHGVGLSQYGARNLAALGVPYPRILKIYFPNYDLRRL